MLCAFFGHKDAPHSLYPKIRENVELLITQRNVDRFMLGNHGEFDYMVLKALRELKQTHPNIRYSVVLAYMPTHKEKLESYTPEETILPEGIETAPKRFAISFRNRWMARTSDVIMYYVTHA